MTEAHIQRVALVVAFCCLLGGLVGTCGAQGQQATPTPEPTYLVMARCVAAEVGPHLPKGDAQYDLRLGEQVTCMWSQHNWWVLKLRRKPELTLAQSIRGYCRIYRNPPAHRRWILELPLDGVTQPPSWDVARDGRWERYAPRWRALLERVRLWLGPCEGPELITHWNHPRSKPRGRMRRAACDPLFAAAGRTRFYTVERP